MQFFSTRTKLIFILRLILLSGFFVTNVISYRASKKQIHSSIVESSLPLARDNVYSEIQRDLTRPIFVSSLMANDTFLKDWVTGGKKQAVTISCGIAGYLADDTLDTLLARADNALYKAKNKGRNCIVTAGQTPEEHGEQRRRP
jgi:GGDEF domain-containing protein